MHLIGLARLGRTVELRWTPDGKAVVNLALAYNYGKKDAKGDRATQWVEAALFDKRAEALAPHLLKGTQLNVHVSDIHIETFRRNDGSEGSKLVGFIAHLEFAGGAPQTRPGPTPGTTQHPSRPAPSHDDMDSDVPF